MGTILRTSFLLTVLVGIFVVAASQPRSVSYRFNRENTLDETTSGPLKRTAASIARALPFASFTRLKGEEEGRVNFLLLGVGGEGHDAPFVTDSIVFASLPENEALPALLVGIPRDLIVRIPSTAGVTKINTLYALTQKQTEEDPTTLIRKAAETVTGQPVHYTIVIDLAGLRGIVAALGGVNVYVPKDIVDAHYPTPSHGVELFELRRGWRFLDGELAEKYMRTRSGSEGDFGRMRRQVQVFEAIQARAQGLNLIGDLQEIFRIFDELRQNIRTDMGLGELRRAWELARKRDSETLVYLALDTQSEGAMLTAGDIRLGRSVASTLWPKAGMFEYSEIQQRIQREMKSE